MYIKKINAGNYYANCYIIGKKANYAAVIDPGGDAEGILEIVNDKNSEVKYIINTHGHFDHIEANSRIKEETGAKILIHKDENNYLSDPDKNLSGFMGNIRITSPEPDRLLEDGEKLNIGEITLDVIHTPGHSPGSISLYSRENNVLFSGDTIFSMGVGRTDFYGSNKKQLIMSIKDKLLTLADETVVLPGHGEKTTIGDFKANIWERISL